MKPSWAVAKFTEAWGAAAHAYRSLNPERRYPRSRTSRCAPPEVPDRVAIAVVPLRPTGAGRHHLVAAGTDVPRFGDQLHPTQDRVLGDDREEGGEHVDVVHRAGQRRRQVEAEAVRPISVTRYPAARSYRDQAQDVRLHHVQRVAAAV